MSVNIADQYNSLFKLIDVKEKVLTFATRITLPNRLSIELDGKNPNMDTKVDDNGTIIADKFVKLQNMSLGLIPINETVLFKICNYQTSTDSILRYDTFWAFNGIVTIDIPYNSVVEWHLKNNNKFEI